MTPVTSSIAAWLLLALAALVLALGLAWPSVRERWRDALGRCSFWQGQRRAE